MTADRRDFLKVGLSGSLVAWGAGVPGFVSRTAHAAPDASKRGARDTILVVVELTGGNDGLNTVVPYRDPEYAKLRPTLKLPASQLKKIDGDLGLHPALGGFAELLEERCLCVVQGVGYPNPSQSHFTSMDVWQAGTTGESRAEGWLGKALKSLKGAGAFHLKGSNQASPLAYEGAPVRVPSIATLQEYQLQLAAASGADKKQQREVIE